MKYYFIIFILFCEIGLTQEKSLLSEIEINPESSHQFISLMISDLIEVPNKSYPDSEFLEDLKVINENLKGYPQDAIKTFLLAELYKLLFNFENQKIIDVDNVYISGTNIDLANEKMTSYAKILSKFSLFIITDMIENYTPFKDDNYINNYLNTSSTKFKDDPSKKKKILLLNRHVGPWIILFNRFSTPQFNSFSQNYIKNYFKTIKHLSKFYAYQKLGVESGDVFLVKDSSIEELLNKSLSIQMENKVEEPIEQSKLESAKKDVESITVEPADGASDKIDEIIKDLDQKKP